MMYKIYPANPENHVILSNAPENITSLHLLSRL